MISKIKNWLIGKVILKKVLGKFVKHGIGTLLGIAGVQQFLVDTGIQIDLAKLESWAIVAIGGLFGALWNFIEHRVKKD